MNIGFFLQKEGFEIFVLRQTGVGCKHLFMLSNNLYITVHTVLVCSFTACCTYGRSYKCMCLKVEMRIVHLKYISI